MPYDLFLYLLLFFSQLKLEFNLNFLFSSRNFNRFYLSKPRKMKKLPNFLAFYLVPMVAYAPVVVVAKDVMPDTMPLFQDGCS